MAMNAASELYRILPGFEVPVGDALLKLSEMWSMPATPEGGKPPSEFRASRMNLVLHFGAECAFEDASRIFYSVLEFSRRYPCRIIALCPQPDSWETKGGMVCKIFSECYIGDSRREMSCCEALILGYTLRKRQYLENQVSIFLESDLPTYYWPYRFESTQLLSDYQFFFQEATRIIFDTAVERFDIQQGDIDQAEKVHDLAYSRLLPIRQCIGQFLSGFSPSAIVDGLDSVRMAYPKKFEAEFSALGKWLEIALKASLPEGLSSSRIAIDYRVLEDPKASPIISFSYSNENALVCKLNLDSGQARIDAHLGAESNSMTASIKLLAMKEALAEALFFC